MALLESSACEALRRTELDDWRGGGHDAGGRDRVGKSLPSGTTLSPLGADDGVPLRVGDRLQAGDYLCTRTDQPYLIWQPNGGLRCCCLVPGEPARGGAARIGYDQAAAGRPCCSSIPGAWFALVDLSWKFSLWLQPAADGVE